ncbi:MAG TPA: hypothetical protein VG498_09630 [Terriglobales bacterium]|nr:hypothetical protein [Terriglobales bacterium]
MPKKHKMQPTINIRLIQRARKRLLDFTYPPSLIRQYCATVAYSNFPLHQRDKLAIKDALPDDFQLAITLLEAASFP